MLTVLNILVPLYFLREDRKASQKTTFSKSFKASIVMTSVVEEIEASLLSTDP